MGLIIKKIIEISAEVLRLVIFTFSLFVTVSFIFIHSIYLLFPKEELVIRAYENFPELKLIWTEIILLSLIGWFIAFKTKKLTLVSPFKLKFEEHAIYFISALYFAIFFKNSYLVFDKFGGLFLIIAVVFFYIALPQISSFFLTFSFLSFFNIVKDKYKEILSSIESLKTKTSTFTDDSIVSKETTPRHASLYPSHASLSTIESGSERFRGVHREGFTLKGISRVNSFASGIFKKLSVISDRLLNRLPSFWILFLAVFSFFSFIIVTIFVLFFIIIRVTTSIDQKIKYENKLRQRFLIREVAPETVTYGTKVIIKGYNLGWSWQNKAKIRSEHGDVGVQTWTDTKIDFVVPLHLKEGRFLIWLERPEDEFTEKLIRSNKVFINLVSASKVPLFDDVNLWKLFFEKE